MCLSNITCSSLLFYNYDVYMVEELMFRMGLGHMDLFGSFCAKALSLSLRNFKRR